jgi:GNAT superfamily N-acetyltransferase
MSMQRIPATTTAPTRRFRVLGVDDRDEAARMLARGFAAEPGAVALFPDLWARRHLFELQVSAALDATIPYATVHGVEVDGKLGAVAIWHPPNVSATSLGAVARATMNLLGEARLAAAQVPHVSAMTLRHARAVVPLALARRRAVAVASRGSTWHLAFLATDPGFRGLGLARLLLEHVLRRCDDDGLGAWLETTDPTNPPLYERFGFEVVEHVEDAAWLPGLWVMRREPTPPTPDHPTGAQMIGLPPVTAMLAPET